MNTERIKSFTLFLLVIMSFVLTTRIWFNASIEGLFVISPNNKTSREAISYDKENLFKPAKLIIHTGINYTLLHNNTKDNEYYSLALNGSKDIIRDWIKNGHNYTQETINISNLEKIRNSKSVELVFQTPIDLETIKGFFNVQQTSWNSVKKFKSIIIVPNENSIYAINEDDENIYKFTSVQMIGVLTSVITQIERRDDLSSYMFLNEFNDPQSLELFGDFGIVPAGITTMPVLNVKKEVIPDGETTENIMAFFNEDSSSISSIKDIYGTVTYTDREEETLKVDLDGVIEYYKYNVSSDDAGFTSLSQALDIAMDYVDQHLGFNYDFFLSNIDSIPQGGRNSYIIKFDYKYNGIPVIMESDVGNALEIETLGNEIKRYKRNVRIIMSEGETVSIKNFTKILDRICEGLSESIISIDDMYLAYYETNDNHLIPIWVLEVKVEGDTEGDKPKQYVKRYYIDAEKGYVLGEQ